MTLSPEIQQQIQDYAAAIAALLHEDTDPDQLQTLDSLETTV